VEEFVYMEDLYERPMHGSIKNISSTPITPEEEKKLFARALILYNLYCKRMNSGLVDRFNSAWTLLHPDWVYSKPDADNEDEYFRSYSLVSAMVLEELVTQNQEKFGYYILLDPEESCTIAGDFSEFWLNIKELKKIR